MVVKMNDPFNSDSIPLKFWATSLRPILAKYLFSPVYCYATISTQKLRGGEIWYLARLGLGPLWIETVYCQGGIHTYTATPYMALPYTCNIQHSKRVVSF